MDEMNKNSLSYKIQKNPFLLGLFVIVIAIALVAIFSLSSAISKKAKEFETEDFSVMLGVELRFYATVNDYLIYGVTEEMLYELPFLLSLYIKRANKSVLVIYNGESNLEKAEKIDKVKSKTMALSQSFFIKYSKDLRRCHFESFSKTPHQR